MNRADARWTFGSAVRPDYLLPGAREAEVVGRHCAFVVPEWHGQWSAIEWERGRHWFGELDPIVAFARERGVYTRGHSLIWERMTPQWARDAMRQDEGWDVVDSHFATMLGRYDFEAVPEWIVVNECIDTEDGDRDMRRTSFQQAFGNGYVHRALETARRHAPKARLSINEYSIEYDNPVDERRRAALLRLVERLRRDGAPLDQVGIQAHLELAKGKLAVRALSRLLRELATMDVEIAITELDVLEDDRTLPAERRDALVADAVRELLDVAAGEPAVTSVATWGLFDQDSWLQERCEPTLSASRSRPADCLGVNRGLPYAADHSEKPMLAQFKSSRA